MNEQQLQQILTIQQAIAAAATAAVINSLLNPQQQQQQQQQQQVASVGASSPTSQIDANSRTAQDLLLHLQQQAAAANLLHQHNDADQHDRPDSRLDSPPRGSSPANSNQQIDTNNQTIQNLLLQLQQQAAGSNPLSAISNASALAALNLNLNNQIPSQMPNIGNTGSPMSRSSGGQNDPLLSASPTTSSNIQQTNQMSSNKKLKRYHQPQANQLSRSSHDATSKPHSSPKNHSSISNLAPRNNSSSTTNSSTSSSSAFLPGNNVGLPRKLVRGQDVWLGRGAEQTRQILKCMWCGQSFRTLAEMTQHMKVTQHYTNIISQEQITSWKQPDSSESSTGKQSSRQSSQSKMLDEVQDTSSEKFNDSDPDDSFSADDEPSQKMRLTKNRQSSANSKPANNSKTKRDPSSEGHEALEQSQTAKLTVKNRKRESEGPNHQAESSMQDDSDAENSSASAVSSQRKSLNNLSDALRGNDATNKQDGSPSPAEKIKPESGEDQTNDPLLSDEHNDDSVDDNSDNKLKSNCGSVKSPASSNRDDDNNLDFADQQTEKPDQVSDDQAFNGAAEDDSNQNNVDCDKITRKRVKDKSLDMDVIKQVNESQKGDGSGDPLSALETMVEKSFDPRMRPGLASGGILQRLGIDEEVCPPWQHINYANWYAAAAYGHPMAAALLAAGMNLQNGIKLSKNMNQKKGDE